MKTRIVMLVIAGIFLIIGCGGIQGVRVDTDWGIVDVQEDGKVSAQIEIDGVEFYIEDNELIEIDVSGVMPEEDFSMIIQDNLDAVNVTLIIND